MNRDPIQEKGGLNLYGFVGNDPIHRIDILGKNWRKWILPIAPWLSGCGKRANSNEALETVKKLFEGKDVGEDFFKDKGCTKEKEYQLAVRLFLTNRSDFGEIHAYTICECLVGNTVSTALIQCQLYLMELFEKKKETPLPNEK